MTARSTPHGGAFRRPVRLFAALLLVIAASASVLIATQPAAADDGEQQTPHGWIAYDSPTGESVLPRVVDDDLTQPLVQYLTDCESAGDTGCGGTPARWSPAQVPVRVCTTHLARPADVGAQEFRDIVARAAEVWNSQEIAAGIEFIGDCSDRDFWVFNNLQNEIGWDDQRQVLASNQAAITRSSIPFSGGVRVIREADVVFEPALTRLPRLCLESTMTHEFGHVLGLGHSDDRNDLMYPSFDPGNIATCKTRPSSNETSRLQALYGVDRAPSVSLVGGPVEPNASVTARASASDPEGSALTYRWQQVSGAPVTLVTEGATARFVAPSQVDAAVGLRVTALDAFQHPATTTATFVVSQSAGPPSNAPSLESFLFGGGDAVLGWSEAPGAATYELCGRSNDFAAQFECGAVSGPSVAINWDTMLGSAGSPNDYRLITSGARETFLRACNSSGCSVPATGGLSGGLRWATWDIDYDYFVLAYDVGTIKFTVVGVVNVSGAPRTFTLGTGPGADPAQQRLAICGMLPPGQVCFGFLGPGAGHGAYVDILAEAPDRPTIEHRIGVR